jgi:SAM-dependent methyltransferase
MDELTRIETAHRCILPSTSRELDLLREAVQTYHVELDNILDVGCGVGHVLEVLQDLGAKGIGLDLNKTLISWLKNKLPNYSFIHEDFRDFYPWSSYSLITMMAVLEHVKEDRKFLRKAFDLLRPGGYLIIVVPAHSKQYCKHDVLYGHFRRYDKEKLKWLLKSCGFVAPEISSYGLQLLQVINSAFIKNTEVACQATVKSAFELPNWYVKLYPIIKVGIGPYNLIQKTLKRTDCGNAYFVVSRRPQ